MMMQYNITVVIKNDKLTTPKATLPSDTSKKRKIKKNSPNQFRLSGKCKVILDIPMATLNFNWGKKKKKYPTADNTFKSSPNLNFVHNEQQQPLSRAQTTKN